MKIVCPKQTCLVNSGSSTSHDTSLWSINATKDLNKYVNGSPELKQETFKYGMARLQVEVL